MAQATFSPVALVKVRLNSNNMDCGNISETNTLCTQLHTHLLINTTDDLFGEGAFTRYALYQAIGQ